MAVARARHGEFAERSRTTANAREVTRLIFLRDWDDGHLKEADCLPPEVKG